MGGKNQDNVDVRAISKQQRRKYYKNKNFKEQQEILSDRDKVIYNHTSNKDINFSTDIIEDIKYITDEELEPRNMVNSVTNHIPINGNSLKEASAIVGTTDYPDYSYLSQNRISNGGINGESSEENIAVLKTKITNIVKDISRSATPEDNRIKVKGKDSIAQSEEIVKPSDSSDVNGIELGNESDVEDTSIDQRRDRDFKENNLSISDDNNMNTPGSNLEADTKLTASKEVIDSTSLQQNDAETNNIPNCKLQKDPAINSSGETRTEVNELIEITNCQTNDLNIPEVCLKRLDSLELLAKSIRKEFEAILQEKKKLNRKLELMREVIDNTQ